jgi:hypothetical protein
MFITKYGIHKLCKLKSALMQQQDILLCQENQQLKQVFYVSQFSTNNVTGFCRKEIYVKILINLIALEENRFCVQFS